MPIRPLAAFLAMALIGCATARLGGPEPLASTASRLPGRDDESDLTPPPAPPEVEPVAVTPLGGEELRRRLVQFVSEAQAVRAGALPGDPMPSVHLARWELIQTDLERFLAAPASADDLSAVRALVQAVFDLDARTYQDLPEPLLQGLDRRLAILEARFDLASPGAVRQLGYRWPLSTIRVTSRYGKRFHPIQRRWKLHAGVDLAADPNEPVLAAGAGMVVRAGWNAGHGYEVEVQHVDGLLTRYSHLAAPLVLEGTPVQPGDAVGLAGRTGTATGVHLHFEFVRGGVPRDPLKEFRKLVATPAPRVVILAPPQRRPKKGQGTHAEEPGA